MDQLRRVDLKTFPVWEFASDEESTEGRDETWVRPVQTEHVPDTAYSLSVAATLTTPEGVAYAGIVGVNTADGFETVHAAVLTEDNYVFIPWPGMAGASKFAQDAAKELRLRSEQLFPLAFRLVVTIQGESLPREGVYQYANSDA